MRRERTDVRAYLIQEYLLEVAVKRVGRGRRGYQPKTFKLSAHSSVISHSSVCDMCLVLRTHLTEILKPRAESKTALEGHYVWVIFEGGGFNLFQLQSRSPLFSSFLTWSALRKAQNVLTTRAAL